MPPVQSLLIRQVYERLRKSEGFVWHSRRISLVIASSFVWPHISADGLSETQTAGRSAIPNSRQRPPASSWAHLTPAVLPPGIPGIGDEIDGAMQQAAQPILQSMFSVIISGG
jgi:hypothetical protein